MAGERLGIKAEDGSVKRWPERYVSEFPYDRAIDPAPTMFDLEGTRYFVVVETGTFSFLPFQTREQLMKEINDFEEDWKQKKAAKATKDANGSEATATTTEEPKASGGKVKS